MTKNVLAQDCAKGGNDMETKLLDGATLKRILLGGAREIRSQIQVINDLNVFPVPDGDTGTNMARTIESGIARISVCDADAVGDICNEFAEGALLGARGNSGVILSQFIAGISDYLRDKCSVSAEDMSRAWSSGVARAYAAVATPVEGTMLTVFRESAEYALGKLTSDSTVGEFLSHVLDESRRSLDRTKEILPALIEADVVDSGGAGYVCIIVGMLNALEGKETQETLSFSADAPVAPDYDLFTTDSVLEYGYCTECLVRLQRSKCEERSFDRDAFVKRLEQLDCNSIVALNSGDVLKVHAHTHTPSKVLEECQLYGEFLNVKIENMSLQHSEITEAKTANGPKKVWGVVTVATGEGMTALFESLGADVVINGGQTGNPSTNDFIEAFKSINADNIIVLPNNGNIYLTATQAKDLYSGSAIHVIPTKTLPEGYSALAVFNSAITDVDEQLSDMTEAKDAVVSGEITTAIRDARINGVEVKEGDAISILGGELIGASATKTEAVKSLIRSVDDLDERELITLFVGEGVTDDERVEMTETLEEEFDELSVSVIIGGQSVYDYLIAIE